MDTNLLDTHQKAVQINLDNTKYGTFAEIGAGQEVARWFFRVGGAAGTIAKSISAYDMTVSDAIYGAAGRYVSRQRLETMLHYEYGLMNERLAAKRGENTRFFVFADTIAAKSYSRKDNFHGWMGIRFQNRPGAGPSQIILHASLLDRETTLQQEAVGILGVNLIHAALYEAAPVALLRHLLDSLSNERIDVDLIEFTGPAFAGVDNRLMSLELVHCGLTEAAMFTAEGKVVQPAEMLYKRPVLVVRGRFRPITNQTVQHAPLRPGPVHEGAGQPGPGDPGHRRDDPPAPPAGRRHRRPRLPRSCGHHPDARPARDGLQLRRVLPAGPVPPPAYPQAHRAGDGRGHAPRALRGEVLHAPGRRHPGIVRADVQERPEGLRLSAAGSGGRRHGDRGRLPAARQAPAPLQLPGRERPHPGDLRLQARIPEHLLGQRLPQAERRGPDLGRRRAAQRGAA